MGMKEQIMRFRSFWIFPLLALLLLFLTRQENPDIKTGDLGWLIPVGVLIWSLLEYGLHRFAFHLKRHDNGLYRVLTESHRGHHSSPRDPDKIFVNTRFGVIVSAVLYVILWLTVGSLFRAAGLMTGIWLGFLYYECVHYAVHLTASNAGLFAQQRRAHFHHHFTNQNRCYGVTTPLWDYVFGTTRISER
jgi:sterol desaturase/sphingolipid hydroxylase (fatty acid hydroxylase superfamily)